MAIRVKRNNWYLDAPGVHLCTGSLRSGDRPPSVAHIEVTERGAGTRAMREVLAFFVQQNERIFVTTGQTTDGERFFVKLVRLGLIEKLGERAGEPAYLIR